jgi:hypothetical protein
VKAELDTIVDVKPTLFKVKIDKLEQLLAKSTASSTKEVTPKPGAGKVAATSVTLALERGNLTTGVSSDLTPSASVRSEDLPRPPRLRFQDRSFENSPRSQSANPRVLKAISSPAKKARGTAVSAPKHKLPAVSTCFIIMMCNKSVCHFIQTLGS